MKKSLFVILLACVSAPGANNLLVQNPEYVNQ